MFYNVVHGVPPLTQQGHYAHQSYGQNIHQPVAYCTEPLNQPYFPSLEATYPTYAYPHSPTDRASRGNPQYKEVYSVSGATAYVDDTGLVTIIQDQNPQPNPVLPRYLEAPPPYIQSHEAQPEPSLDLLNRAKKAGYRVYALTDNINEIVEHLKSTYDFWPLFDGVTVSAEVGLLKPQPEIYFSLLSQQDLLSPRFRGRPLF